MAVEPLGQRLLRLRRARGLRQLDLAGPGMSAGQLSRIERDQRKPSLEALQRLSRGLGVSIHYLQTGNPISPMQERELRLQLGELDLALDTDPAAAEADLRPILASLEAGEQPALRARAQLALGLCLLRSGRAEQGLAPLEAAQRAGRLAAALRSQLLEALARAYLACARPASALELIEHALHTPPAGQEQELRLRLALVLAELEPALGQQARAAELLQEATDAPQEPIAAAQAVRLRAQAEHARQQGEPEEATRLLAGAHALAELEASTRRLGAANLVLVHTLRARGLEAEAQAALARGEPLLSAVRPGRELGLLRAEQARAAAADGAAEAASAYAEQALELLPGSDPDRGLASLAQAGAARAAGDQAQADEWFARALEELSASGRFREAAHAAQEWAEALRAAGQPEQAATVLEQATRLHLRRLAQGPRPGGQS